MNCRHGNSPKSLPPHRSSLLLLPKEKMPSKQLHKIPSIQTTLFTVLVPAPTHPDSLTHDLDPPHRPPIPLQAQLDLKHPPLSNNGRICSAKGLVIVCHGLLDNRHKPLVSFLRDVLPYDIVTFDFRGTGESGGRTSFANHGQDADDIAAVVSHCERHYGQVKCVMGHSAGGAAVCIWAGRYPHQSSRVGRIVTINSLFYNGVPPKDGIEPADPLGLDIKKEKLPYHFATFRKGKQGKRDEQVHVYATQRDLDYRNHYLPMSNHLPKIPPNVRVLTLLGDLDPLTVLSRDIPLWKHYYGRKRDLTIQVLHGCEHLYVVAGQQQKAGRAIVEWLGGRWADDERGERGDGAERSKVNERVGSLEGEMAGEMAVEVESKL